MQSSVLFSIVFPNLGSSGRYENSTILKVRLIPVAITIKNRKGTDYFRKKKNRSPISQGKRVYMPFIFVTKIIYCYSSIS